MKAKFGICTVIATIIFNISTAPLVSQAPTATGQANLQPDVETVSLDLAVRDRHNRPILDLKPEELTVADNGKPAKLAKLRLVNATTGSQGNGVNGQWELEQSATTASKSVISLRDDMNKRAGGHDGGRNSAKTKRSQIQQFPSIWIDGADCRDGGGRGPAVGKLPE
jgi:hypothetical protein